MGFSIPYVIKFMTADLRAFFIPVKLITWIYLNFYERIPAFIRAFSILTLHTYELPVTNLITNRIVVLL